MTAADVNSAKPDPPGADLPGLHHVAIQPLGQIQHAVLAETGDRCD